MKNVEEIYNEMRNIFIERTGLDAGADGDLAARFYAVAAQIHALYLQAAWTERQCFPQTAAGEYLDYHAALRGVERRKETKAGGILRFSVEKPIQTPLKVEAGTVCMTAGLVRFETVEDGELPAGEYSVDIPAEAVEPGVAGNVAAETVISMTVAPTGIAHCSNPAAFAGGTDEEDDESLRTRILETYRRMSNGANAAFYRQKAMSFDEVAAAVVTPRARGVGTVNVVVAAYEGVPNKELLEKLQTCFDEVREIAVNVQVLAPETQTVEVSASVRAAEGYDTASVLEKVRNVITGYFDGTRLGKDVLLAELGAAIFAVEGVENYSFACPEADCPMGETVLPVLGALTVELMN